MTEVARALVDEGKGGAREREAEEVADRVEVGVGQRPRQGLVDPEGAAMVKVVVEDVLEVGAEEVGVGDRGRTVVDSTLCFCSRWASRVIHHELAEAA